MKKSASHCPKMLILLTRRIGVLILYRTNQIIASSKAISGANPATNALRLHAGQR
jgi:hypothetical protein